MKQYKQNEEQRDIFYAEQTKSRKQSAREENEQKKKESQTADATPTELFESVSENVPTSI